MSRSSLEGPPPAKRSSLRSRDPTQTRISSRGSEAPAPAKLLEGAKLEKEAKSGRASTVGDDEEVEECLSLSRSNRFFKSSSRDQLALSCSEVSARRRVLISFRWTISRLCHFFWNSALWKISSLQISNLSLKVLYINWGLSRISQE